MDTLARARHTPKEIIAVAKQWLAEQYADENIKDIGLEEVRFEAEIWNITIGFKRKRAIQNNNVFKLMQTSLIDRTDNGDVYEFSLKIVSISDKTGEVLSMRDRLTD